MQRPRHLFACSLILFGLGLRFVAEVRAQPAAAKPAPVVGATPSLDAGVADAAPGAADTAPGAADAGTQAAPSEAPTALPPADAGVETSPAAPVSPATPTEDATSTGSGLFEQSLSGTPDPASDAAAERPFDLTGYVRGDMFIGKVPGVAQPDVKAGYGELSLKFQTKKEKYGDALAEARIRYGHQSQGRQVYLDLREAYVNAYLGPVDLRLGQQIIVWGRADAFNPTNNIGAVDFRIRSPVEDDRRLGNVGARMFVNFEPVRIEGVWMPLFVPTELPAGVAPDFVVFNPPNYPPPELEKGLAAARVHLEFPAFETSVSYLFGYAPFAGFVANSFTTTENAQVFVTRTPYNHHVIGWDFSTAFGELLALRGEAAYRRPLDYQNRDYAPRPDLQYVLGVDRSFGSVNVIAQYMGRYTFDWQLEPGSPTPLTPEGLAVFPDNPGTLLGPQIMANIELEIDERNQILFSQRAKVQHLATARIEWVTLQDTLSLSALGMMNFTTKEWLLFPKLAYDLSDAMSTSVGAEIYVGPDDTLFGLVDAAQSAGYAELRVSF